MARLKDALKETGIEITDEIEEKLLKEFKETKDFDEQAKKLSELEKVNLQDLQSSLILLKKKRAFYLKLLKKKRLNPHPHQSRVWILIHF